MFEQIEASPRANIGNAIRSALATEPPVTKWSAIFSDLKRVLPEPQAVKLITAIARTVYMIEPVNSSITSTKFACRWSINNGNYFSFSEGDPRWSSFEQCDALADELLANLAVSLSDRSRITVLRMALEHRVLAHEVPLDYIDSAPGVGSIHRPGNLAWIWEGPAEATVRLRSWLLEQTDFILPLEGETVASVMSAAIDKKICVKTYLTDRAQTGPYQTNREKRWEAHPSSVQFASRASASAIERELLEQICFFDDFPEACREAALEEGVLREREVTRCPITLDKLGFPRFAQEVTNPQHGRSFFQVGHLNPLKTVQRTFDAAGHTAQNIAWISSAGNRIQGDLSLVEARRLVQHIANNYRILLGPG